MRISRRGALLGASAAAASAIVLLPGESKARDEQLEQLYAEMIEARRAEAAAEHRHIAALKEFEEKHPWHGPIFRLPSGERVGCDYESVIESVFQGQCWRHEMLDVKNWPERLTELDGLIARGNQAPELRDEYQREMTALNRRIRHDVKQRKARAIANLRAKKAEHEILRERAGVTALNRQYDLAHKRTIDAEDRFMKGLANGPHGVLLKVRELVTEMDDDGYPAALVRSTLADLERLAGEARS